MKKILSFTVLFAFWLLSYTQNSEYLRIQDVADWGWNTQNGSIDSIIIMVEPKGIYAEIQLLVDYSTRGTVFNQGDSLEIQMGFHLPYEAEVIDLWLWFYDIPVQAYMLDRWKATMIYESIVNRRQDPVLLVRNSDTFYDMKIFPLLNDLPRRIKLTYLLPLSKLTSSDALLSLPMNFLKLSTQNILSARICYRDSINGTIPSIIEIPNLSFTAATDPYFGDCLSMNIQSSISGINALTMKTTGGSSSSNAYAGYYNSTVSNENYFEIELDLRDIFNINKHKKTMFMFDFVQLNSTLNNHYVVNTFKNYVRYNFTAGDSINIMLSGLYPGPLSSQWVSADSASLEQFLALLLPSSINTTTNLYSLLTEGIDFIRNNGNDGTMFLISSSSSYTSVNAANSFINTIMAYMGNPKIPIHIISVDDKSNANWGINNMIYRGNQYLFSNLALLSGGEFEIILRATMDIWNWYYYYHYTTYENMLSSVISKLSGYFTSNNVFAGLQTGFTYSVYNINSSSGFTYFDNPYRICGKYNGSFPFQLHMSAVDNTGITYNAQVNIDNTNIRQLDSTLKSVWAGQYLRELYTYSQNNSIINHIITTSINERVLSKYTALLAVEPGMLIGDTIALPVDNPNNPGTDIDDENNGIQDDEMWCKVFPNPVSDKVNFNLNFSDNKRITIEIFNVLNQKFELISDIQMYAGSNTYTCDISHFPAGTYFYRIITEDDILFTGKIVVITQ